MSRSSLAWTGCCLLMLMAPRAVSVALAGNAPPAKPAPAASVARFVKNYCSDCHSGEKPDAGLNLSALAFQLDDARNRRLWRMAYRRIHHQEMPPTDSPQPSDEERAQLMTMLRQELTAADAADRSAHGRVVLRRLNREEYERTVCDLLGIRAELKDLLPLDSSANGFDNVGEALHVSSFSMERYLEAADVALDVAIANMPQPPLIQKRYSLKEAHQVRVTTEKVFRKSDEESRVVMFASSPWQAVSLSPFYPPDRGDYRFRISASAIQSQDRPVTFRVDAGLMLMTGKPHLVSYFDAPPGEPKIIEFVDSLAPRNTIRILPYGLASAQAVNKVGADAWEGPGVAIDWIEVEGPLHSSWPPESHQRLFGDLKQAPAPAYNQSKRVEVISSVPEKDADRVLRPFLRRAFRRPVSDADVAPYLALVKARLEEGESFERAVRAALSAALIAPDFLFLREKPGPLDDFALASRLSYFLWSSMPDEELFQLAERNELHAPATLRAQAERMLKSPRAAAFTKNFVGQWLGLREIDFTLPSHILYPEFDEMLKVSMVREPELFFEELLKNDLSLTNFIASDFSMLNGRLAKHYGIPGPDGWEFRRTPLPADSHRGGVMTMAAVLKVTANGTSTSPVMRGAWVMDRILGTPPPKPPENISAIEPDIRGASTIREQLAKHRQIESCASCHRQIDPPGFALESFDVIGGWREFYRSQGNGKPVIIDGRRMPYLHGKPVDPADRLEDGRAFKNIDELKALLITDPDQLTRALATRLVTYATGGPPEEIDREQIERIVAKARERNYGLRSLILALIDSELFRSK